MPKKFSKRNGAAKQVFAVIGHPVSHSLSPAMHKAAFKKLHLHADYQALDVEKKNLAKILKKIRDGEIAGINVTVPHKQAVVDFVDSLSSTAKRTNSVNTIYWHKNKLMGDSTDGAGYVTSLKNEARFLAKNKNIVILGAGGASLAIAVALCESGITLLTLVNRHIEKAKNQIKKYQKIFPKIAFAAIDFTKINAFDFTHTHLVINTTSLGLKNNPWPSLDFVKNLKKNTLVSDIVYNPKWTPLLMAAKKQSLKTHFGYGMLLYQGVLAFEKFTGRKAPVAVMKKILLKNLL